MPHNKKRPDLDASERRKRPKSNFTSQYVNVSKSKSSGPNALKWKVRVRSGDGNDLSRFFPTEIEAANWYRDYLELDKIPKKDWPLSIRNCPVDKEKRVLRLGTVVSEATKESEVTDQPPRSSVEISRADQLVSELYEMPLLFGPNEEEVDTQQTDKTSKDDQNPTTNYRCVNFDKTIVN